MSETLYMRISTQNIACSQRNTHTSFSYILWAYGEHIMSKWSSRTSDQFIWLVSERERLRQTEGQTDRQTLRKKHWDRPTERLKIHSVGVENANMVSHKNSIIIRMNDQACLSYKKGKKRMLHGMYLHPESQAASDARMRSEASADRLCITARDTCCNSVT